MRKFSNSLFATVVAIGLFGSLLLASSRPGKTTTGTPIPVQVTNTAAAPALARNVDTDALQPVQFTLSPSSSTSSSSHDTFTVPAGKRLVIEYYSAQLTQYPSGGYAYMYLITVAGGNSAYYKVIPPVASTVPYNQPTKIYADPGTTIEADVTQSSGTSSGGNIIVSGHYVNVP